MTRWLFQLTVGTLLTMIALPAAMSDNTTGPVTCLRLTADGQTLIQVTRSKVHLCSALQLEILQTVSTSMTHVCRAVLDEAGGRLYLGGGVPAESGMVEAWSFPQLQRLWQTQVGDDLVYGLALDATGGRLTAGCHDAKTRLLNAHDGQLVATFGGHSGPVRSVLFLTTELLLTASDDQTIRVREAATGSVIRTLGNHTAPVTGIAVRPTSNGLPLTATSSVDRTVRFWQPTIGRMVRFARYSAPVQCVEFLPDGSRIVAGCRDGRLRVTDVQTLQTVEKETSLQGWITSIAVHPVNRTIFAGSSAGTTTVLRLDPAPSARAP